MNGMKTSDKKKYEKAWKNFYKETGNFMLSLERINNLPDHDLRVDEINQISTSIEKVTKTINRICDCHNIKEGQILDFD